MICGHCGKPMNEDTIFCGECGNKVQKPQKSLKKIIVIAFVIIAPVVGFLAWQTLSDQKSDAIEQTAGLAKEAEEVRIIAEQTKIAEEAGIAAEQAKAAQQALGIAEQARVDAERALAAAKKANSAEQARIAAEAKAKAKADAEHARVAEQARVAAEQAIAAEQARIAAEQARVAADARAKADAEEARIAAERARVQTVTLAAGTPIKAITPREISTQTSNTGDGFTMILNEDITDGSRVIARRGATVMGVISESDPGGRVKGVATISVTLTGITLADGSEASIGTNDYHVDAPTTVAKDATRTGVAAGIGAAIGGILGGGRGAAIGAGAGAAAGTGAALATRGDPAVIVPETVITFNLSAPLTVTMQDGARRQ